MAEIKGLHSTPVKWLTSVITANGKKMSAEDVNKQVKQELEKNTFIATDLEGFLNSLFPFQAFTEDVLEGLVKDGLYDHEEGWAGKPRSDAPESKYYDWFAGLAEKIVAKYLEQQKIINEERTFITKWIVNPNKAPSTLSHIGSLVRPDISNVVLSREEYTSQNQDKQIEKDITAQQTAATKARESDEGKLEAAVASLLTKLAVWWSRANVVVEIKKDIAKSPLQHIEQLIGYVQHVLREQLDRRSAIGLLFCKTQLAVWHADRSGILGTQDAFDIHEDPEKFIQVILGCSVGEPSTLGYDPSMKLWLSSRPEPLPSYHPDVSPEYFRKSTTDKNWVINMPGPSTDPSKRTDFLTINAISTVRASNISGRGTVVWVAMKYDDIGKKDHKIYVLKQCWRPTTAPSEASLIPKGVPNISQVYSAEDVTDESNNRITTVEYLRHGQHHSQLAFYSDDKDIAKQHAQAELFEATETKSLVFTLLDHKIPIESHPPISRVQSRLVMEDYGWPIHHFCDLLELLRILKEVVQAQKDLYFKHRTLQRDISIGNILIVPSKTNEHSTHAYLIDYDYARQAERDIPSVLGTLHSIGGSWKSPMIEAVRAAIKEQGKWEIQPDLDRLLGIYISDMKTYHVDVAKLFTTARNQKLSASDLGLLAKGTKVPDFQSLEAQSRERSATIPFASCEILANRKLFTNGDRRPYESYKDRGDLQQYVRDKPKSLPLHHDPGHDIEALHWLLTWICLTRSGPGGQRRTELRGDPDSPITPPQTLKLHNLCRELFLEENLEKMAQTKSDILSAEANAPYPPEFFGNYFKPLEGLWNQLRKIIEVAHHHPIFEAVHDFVLEAIDVAIKQITPNNTERTAEEQNVLDERQEQLRGLKDFTATNGDSVIPLQPTIPSMDLSPAKAPKKTTPAGNNNGAEGSGNDGSPSRKRQRTSARLKKANK